MKKTIYYCDHCGVELEGNSPEEYWGSKQRVDAVLCDNCSRIHVVFEEGMTRMMSGLMDKYFEDWKGYYEAYSIEKKFVHIMDVKGENNEKNE